jgi:hypothetical protein
MVRDRYAPMHFFNLVPILSLAMAPVLTKLHSLLDDDRVLQMGKAHGAPRFPHTPTTGRPSPPVAVMLCRLLITHV